MVEQLRRDDFEVSVMCRTRLAVGYASRWPNHRLLGPDSYLDPDGFLSRLEDVLKAGRYDVVIPLYDPTAELLSLHKAHFSQWAHIAVVDYDVFVQARDKFLTMDACMQRGIPCPITIDPTPDTIEDRLDEIAYPLIVKPRRAHGAIGFSRIDDRADLARVFRETVAEHGPCVVQEFIPPGGGQYKGELFIENGVVKAGCAYEKLRHYPLVGGSATLLGTTNEPVYLDMCADVLRAIGWEGYADFDLIGDPRDDVIKVMEINPRITGGIRLCFDAGVNFAKMIVDHAQGRPVTGRDGYERGRYLWFFYADIVWKLRSPERFSAQPGWLELLSGSTRDFIFSIRDPLPSVAFVAEYLQRSFKGQPE